MLKRKPFASQSRLSGIRKLFLRVQRKPNLKQISVENWPTSLEHEVMQLSLTPADIMRRCRLSFVSMHDDLDQFQACVFHTSNGKSVALQYYPRAPVSGTNVIVENVDMETLISIVNSLQLRASDVRWISDDVKQQVEILLKQRSKKHGPTGRSGNIRDSLIVRTRHSA